MKRIICLVLAAVMIAFTCLVLAGCGEDKKDAANATAAPTQAATNTSATQNPAAQSNATQAPAAQSPAAQAPAETSAEAATQAQGSGGVDLYGGITSKEAVEMALAYVGDGYEVVSNEQRYLRNQEAWYVGVKAFTVDSTVYYLYVMKGEVAPVTAIPDRSNGQSGLWGGIDLNTAVEYAISYLGDDYRVTGSEMSEFNGADVWWITAESANDTRILYVNSNGVIGEAV